MKFSNIHIHHIFKVLMTISLIGCASVETRQPNIANQLSSWPNPDALNRRETFVKGLPYHLPTTMLTIALKTAIPKGKQDKLTEIEVTPTLVPDPEKRFVLQKSNNLIFAREHKLDVEGGLLKKVNTTDVSKLGDAIVEVASIALTLATGKGTPVPSPSAPKMLDTQDGEKISLPSISAYPTAEEIDELFQMIPLGDQKYSMPLHGQFSTSVPGTRDILQLSARMDNATRSDHQPSWQRPDHGTAKAILVRTLVSRNVLVELRVSMAALYAWRREKADVAIQALKQSLASTKLAKASTDGKNKYHSGQLRVWQGKLDNAKTPPTAERKTALTTRIAKHEEEVIKSGSQQLTDGAALAQATRNLTIAEQHKGKLRGKGFKTIRTSKLPVSVTDDAHTYAIPIESAFLGTTNNDVTLDKGIVTNISMTEPALIYEFIKIPANIVRSAIGVRTTRAAQQEMNIKQEIDLLKAKADLEAAKKGNLPQNQLIDDKKN